MLVATGPLCPVRPFAVGLKRRTPVDSLLCAPAGARAVRTSCSIVRSIPTGWKREHSSPKAVLRSTLRKSHRLGILLLRGERAPALAPFVAPSLAGIMLRAGAPALAR